MSADSSSPIQTASDRIGATSDQLVGYAGEHYHNDDRQQYVITLVSLWILSFAAISLVVGLPFVVLAAVANIVPGAFPLMVGFVGATVLTGWVGYQARGQPREIERSTNQAVAFGFFESGSSTAGSVLDRLVEFAATAYLTRQRRAYALAMLGMWLVLVVASVIALMIVLWPVGLVATVGGTPSTLGFFIGSGVTGWVLWQSRKQAHQRQADRSQDQNQQRQGDNSQNQGQQTQFVSPPPDMDFSDVAGMDDLKHELHSKIIDPLANPEFYDEYGLGIENGILFYGPPGTGKTYMAKALAGQLGINHISAKAGDLVSKWIGEGAQNVQRMFDEARANQPCLIFVDEIDALATDRGTHQSKSERQMVNQFLEELTELSDGDHNVIVIGATNRIDDIDSAMLRTGRFTEKIEVPPPDAEARVAVFRMHLSAPSEQLSWHEIAEQTEGFVASDMESVAQRAARKAMQRARSSGGTAQANTKVTQQDVTKAIGEVQQGRAAAD